MRKKEIERNEQRCKRCAHACKQPKGRSVWCEKFLSQTQARELLRRQEVEARERRLKESGLGVLERSMVARELCGNPGRCRAKDPEVCLTCGWYRPLHEKRVAALRRRYGPPTEKGTA